MASLPLLKKEMIENLYHPEALKARRNKKAHWIWAF
jgi:hypothetical protein